MASPGPESRTAVQGAPRLRGDSEKKPLRKTSALATDKGSGATYVTIDGPEPPARGKSLLKLFEEKGGPRAAWAVDLDELAGYEIGVDTSGETALVWILFGGGFATFTRVEDLGEKAGSVTHFGGPERWGGMLQCASLAVDGSGDCWCGRNIWTVGGLLYRNSHRGKLTVWRFPSGKRWVRNALVSDPDGQVWVHGGKRAWRLETERELEPGLGRLLALDCADAGDELALGCHKLRREHGLRHKH